MITLATAHATSPSGPEPFFDRWADMATWPEWNLDTEWVRLDGTFTQGATGQLKPRGGPTVRFTVERLVPGHEFVDVSHLVGARLTFDHQITPGPDGGCRIDVTVTLAGPLALAWKLLLGGGIKASAQPDLDRLVAAVADAGAQTTLPSEQ